MSSIEEIVEDTDITQSTTDSANDDKKVLTWPKGIMRKNSVFAGVS